MRYPALMLKMLRYRVALTTFVPFFLLGIAVHGGMTRFSWSCLWGMLAIGMSHIVATSLNDIADYEIDAINLKTAKGRPLVTGEATKKHLYSVIVVAIAAMIFFAALIGKIAVLIAVVSVVIDYLYSMPPIQLSHRADFAPVALSLLYVCLPYLFGSATVTTSFTPQDGLLLVGLFILFCGRILLKDFRDRKGDSLYGKRTFLLRHGKDATCAVSLLCVVVGNVIFSYTLVQTFGIFPIAIMEVYFLPIIFMLYKLWKATGHDQEQAAIGIGAKMANGFLITLLGLFILQEYGASMMTYNAFVFIFVVLYLLLFAALMREPDKTIIGYRG